MSAVLVSDVEVYGRPGFGGRVWKCPTTTCDQYVGAHRTNGAPKGTLAGPALRAARIRAHAAFDGWWKAAGIRRRAAYAVLSDRMGVAEAHIGNMTIDECEFVVDSFSGSQRRRRRVGSGL